MYDIFFVGNTNDRWLDLKKTYPNAQLFSYGTIQDLQKQSLTQSFWVIWSDIELEKTFDLNEYKTTIWDKEYIHIFKNGNYYDGICLIPKNADISNKEFVNRFFSNKKEIDVVASYPVPFEKFYISNYDDYIKACNSSSTSMFYAIWDDIELLDFNFKYQVPTYNQNIVHIFKNGEYYDGVCLFPKNNIYAKKEIDKRFFQIKKEIDIVVSIPKNFDVVFISFNEQYADKHYNRLIEIVKRPVIRINGIKGIHNAHIEAAKQVTTNMFWVVDADAEVLETFKFDKQIAKVDQDIVFVWQSKNEVNSLEYGNGGVKLLPTALTLQMKITTADMTTSISGRFRAILEISNINKFNTDPFNSWKSSFRECCKLASKVIQGQVDHETESRLQVWCSETTDIYALHGALQGKKYGFDNRNNHDALQRINDFEWLKERFDERY